MSLTLDNSPFFTSETKVHLHQLWDVLEALATSELLNLGKHKGTEERGKEEWRGEEKERNDYPFQNKPKILEVSFNNIALGPFFDLE